MALSAAARAALEKFKSQTAAQAESAVSAPDEMAPYGDADAYRDRSAYAESNSEEEARDAAAAHAIFDGQAPDEPLSPEELERLPSLGQGAFVVEYSAGRNAATAPVNIGRMNAGYNGLYRPEQPKTLREAGISYRVVESLLLKTIKQEGALNEVGLSRVLHLGINVFRDVLLDLHKRELLDMPQPLQYDLTTKGRELTALLEREDGYVGPAPVSFRDYCDMCRRQATRERRVSQHDVDTVFASYPMRPELRRTLKEGFNSQRVILFYGPPGNGKSLITDNLHRLLRDPVLLPHAFEFNGKVVKLYDPAYHKMRTDLMEKEENERLGNISASDKPDRRWLICDPPLVTVGTEFKVEHFEVSFDGQYSAPPHVKANNGIFIFDDLGRQTEDHNMILNQFIYPLEQRESIVRFAGGSSLRTPFLQRLFLSTNLNHEEIIDDAFKRRLLYQVLVDRPTLPLWKDIFRNEAARCGVKQDVATHCVEKLAQWYREDERIIRACDPRNLFIMIDAALEDGDRVDDHLDEAMLRRIYDHYPAAYNHEIKFYVGAMGALADDATEEAATAEHS